MLNGIRISGDEKDVWLREQQDLTAGSSVTMNVAGLTRFRIEIVYSSNTNPTAATNLIANAINTGYYSQRMNAVNTSVSAVVQSNDVSWVCLNSITGNTNTMIFDFFVSGGKLQALGRQGRMPLNPVDMISQTLYLDLGVAQLSTLTFTLTSGAFTSGKATVWGLKA